MAKRNNPYQGDLFTAVALEYMAPHDALVGEVLEAIQDVLPPGVPTYVKEVRSVVRDPLGAINATLVMFDGLLHHLSISGPKGARCYAWLDLRTPFGWDEGVRGWRRYSEYEEAAAPDADQPKTEVALSPGERLMAAGLVEATWTRLGGDLRDPDAPDLPRSLARPLFGKVLGTGEIRLYLTMPSAADLPFVRRVEEVSGLTAVWDYQELLNPFAHRAFHAEDLATDEGWETLAASLEHTITDYVTLYAARAAIEGRLAIPNARSLMEAAGVSEPESPGREAAIARLQVHPSGQVSSVVSDAWAVIHAAEATLLKPGGWASGYKIPPCLTEAGRTRFGLPPKRQPKSLRIGSASEGRPNAR